MGEFHCPMGAAFYDDEGCILCEMCTAQTEQEMVAASKRIRDYLKSHAPAPKLVQKIAICGKGGVGKSTIVVLIANALISKGYSVLALDTDESNPGLSRLFGFDREPIPLITLLSRFSTGDPSPDVAWLQHDKLKISDIPVKYILNRDGLKFMMSGKILDPFQGCACTMADVTRELTGKILVADKEIVLVDMEAGVESFGRGVERNMDTILIVVEPSFESMALADKINYMAKGMGIARVKAIFNKVPSPKIEGKMIEELSGKKIETIGTVFYDLKLNEAGFEGKILDNSAATKNVQTIVESLLKETKQLPS